MLSSQFGSHALEMKRARNLLFKTEAARRAAGDRLLSISVDQEVAQEGSLTIRSPRAYAAM